MVAIGIDLGTTNTVVAAVVDGVAVTLEDDHGRRLLPSVVSFHPSSTVLVGEPARERRLIDPLNTIFSAKTLLGRSWESPEVKAARVRLPFKLAQGTKNSTNVVAREVSYAIPEISAFVLRRAKAIAEAALGQPVERAVITVPANFNELQRASTKIAGKLAGLEVLRILNEPTAAALAYGQAISESEKIAVYDLGGGTFDVTLLDLAGNVFEVLGTAGDTALGGDDIDRAIADKIALDMMKRFNVDPRNESGSAARILFVAEEIKKELSSAQQAKREIADIGIGPGGKPVSMQFVMTRPELEAIAKPFIDRTVAVAKGSMESVGLTPAEFDRVILVGGSTRMPIVGRSVEKLFGKPPHLRVNPEEVVALGAAIQAHALDRSPAKSTKRKSAHDQLAHANAKPAGERSPNRPPETDPTGAMGRPPPRPGAPAQPAAPTDLPAFFSFNKAPAVISFSSAPAAAGPVDDSLAPPKLPPLDLPPLVPRNVPKLRTPTLPMAFDLDDVSASPPASPDAFDAPGLDGGWGGPSDIVAAPVSLPEPDLALPSGPPPRGAQPDHLSSDLFSGIELGGAPTLELDHERFAQGTAIKTSAASPLLIDVTPLSLGVETVGGYADIIIPANSPVPCEKTRTFLTASDGQTVVSIKVAQGESSKFASNTRLGDLVLSDLRKARRGEVKVEVTFELDADGILNVRALDPDTGRANTASMKLLGASTDEADVGAMAARQAQHDVA